MNKLYCYMEIKAKDECDCCVRLNRQGIKTERARHFDYQAGMPEKRQGTLRYLHRKMEPQRKLKTPNPK